MAYQFTQTGQEIQYLLNEAENLAEEYDSTVSYAVDEYCSYNGVLYRCTTATSGGTFDASYWTAVIVLDEINALMARMTTAESDISDAQDDISSLNTSLTNYLRPYTSETLAGGSGSTLTLSLPSSQGVYLIWSLQGGAWAMNGLWVAFVTAYSASSSVYQIYKQGSSTPTISIAQAGTDGTNYCAVTATNNAAAGCMVRWFRLENGTY